MYFIRSQVGYAVGAYNILKTTDGGDTWSEYLLNSGKTPLYSVHFYNAETVFVAGGDYPGKAFIMRTIDGGLTWQETRFPVAGSFNSVFATAAYKVYCGGSSGSLFGTSSGGITGSKELTVPLTGFVLKAYPNPSYGPVTIRYTLPFSSDGLKPGLYFHTRRANDRTETGKIILME